MKKIITIITFFIASITCGFSQLSIKVEGGVSPQSTPLSAGLIVNRMMPHEEFVFSIEEVGPQYFGGIKAHLELVSPFFADFGLSYAKRNTTYLLRYTMIDAEHPVSNYIMNESDHILLLPVNLGVRFGALDVTSGMRAMRSISFRTDLDQLPGFMRESNIIKLGWQAGIGFTMLDTRLGIEYAGNFSRIGKGMFVNNQSLELMNVPGQFVFSIQRIF